MFISYSWSNSHSAAEKSGKFGPEALGWADPRQIKAVLQEAGIRCWIDIEMVGKEKVRTGFCHICPSYHTNSYKCIVKQFFRLQPMHFYLHLHKSICG